MNPRLLRWGGAAGLLGAVLNVAAVVFLRDQPHAYKPHHLNRWLAELLAHPTQSAWSAWCFTAGLELLLLFALALWRGVDANNRRLMMGALLFAFGAFLDGAGTPVVAYIAHELTQRADAAQAQWLLSLTLYADAAFNLLLGVGLLFMAHCVPSPRWLQTLGFIAGAVSVPVCAQAFSEAAADFLVVSGPLWLAWVMVTSVRMLRGLNH